MPEPTIQANFETVQSWLQQLVQESQATRAASQELLAKFSASFQQNGQAVAPMNTERKVDDLRNYFDGRLNKIEANQNDFRNLLNEIRAKVDKLG